VPVTYGRLTVVDEVFVARAHTQGRQVHVWTVNDRAEMRRLLELGVDGIVTDEAELLLDVISTRSTSA
jgi:glycerophosphoryl diester phosphodiesterase